MQGDSTRSPRCSIIYRDPVANPQRELLLELHNCFDVPGRPAALLCCALASVLCALMAAPTPKLATSALVPPPPAPLFARPYSPVVPANNSGRRRRFTMAAASPLVEEATRATEMEPLTKEDLIAYLASGCKPRSDWRFVTSQLGNAMLAGHS